MTSAFEHLRMTRAERLDLERAIRMVEVRRRQLDRYVAKYVYWSERAATDYSQEQYNAAFTNMKYWAGMHALALAHAETLRQRIQRRVRSSNGR